MRGLALVLALTATAAAEPITRKPTTVAIGAGFSVFNDDEGVLAIGVLQVAVPLARHIWLDLGFGAGGVARYSFTSDAERSSRVYEARSGAGWLRYGRYAATGVVASAGYTTQRTTFIDNGLLGDGDVFQRNYDRGFGEVRAIGRIRITGYAAVELSLGARIRVSLAGNRPVEFPLAGVGTFGIHATL